MQKQVCTPAKPTKRRAIMRAGGHAIMPDNRVFYIDRGNSNEDSLDKGDGSRRCPDPGEQHIQGQHVLSQSAQRRARRRERAKAKDDDRDDERPVSIDGEDWMLKGAVVEPVSKFGCLRLSCSRC